MYITHRGNIKGKNRRVYPPRIDTASFMRYNDTTFHRKKRIIMANNKSFFDSKFVRFGNKLTDLMLLQFATLLCCLPIVTIGASFTAMYHVLLKMYRDEEPYVFREFFKAFKSNFKQSTIIWLIYIGFFAALYLALVLILNVDSAALRLGIYLLPIPLIVGILSLNWVFILQSRYENSILQTIKNALIVALGRPIRTFTMLVLNLSPMLVLIITLNLALVVLVLGLSGPGFINAIFFSQFFDQQEGTNWRKERAQQMLDELHKEQSYDT